MIYGENQAEYGNDIKDNESYFMNSDFYSIKDNENIENLVLGGKKIKEIVKDTKFQIKDFASYIPLKESLIKEQKISMIYLGYFERWDPQENFYYAVENTGFRPANERSEGTYSKYASLDDKFAGFHNYFAYLKFGLGRATSDAAHEIRDGHITRDEGVALVRKFDGEFPKKHFKEFLEYIDMTEAEFKEIEDEFDMQSL